MSVPKKTKVDVLPQVEAVPEQRTVGLVDYSDDEDTSRHVGFLSQDERRELLTEGSGSTLATPELDSAMGIGSWIDPSTEDSGEVAYRQLKELVDEPVPSGSKEDSSKPKLKLGMRSGAKKGSKS